MAILTGESIPSFNSLGTSAPQRTDRFFTSQVLLSAAMYKEYLSKSLKYGDLVEQLFSDLSAGFGFKSMAYELSDQYSFADHVHLYNSFDVKADYPTPNSGHILLATFKVGNKVVRMCMPRPWRYLPPEPLVGQLKFKILPSIVAPNSININSDSFDGWVYPAGQTYTVAAADFVKAKKHFRSDGNGSATSFAVPNIGSNFIKAAPDLTAFSSVEWSTSDVPSHYHTTGVTVGNSDPQSVTVTAPTTKSPGRQDGNQYMHNGSKPAKNPKMFNGTLAFDVTGLTITESEIASSDSSMSREQYPSYNNLPVMIYIGKKR